MSCLIIRNPDSHQVEQVLAPNGKPSILYHKILSELKDNLTADSYIHAALDQHMIRDNSKPEVALALWSKIYTEPFKNWLGDWEASGYDGPMDKNGEPDIIVTPDGKFLTEASRNYFSLDDAPDDLVYDLRSKSVATNPVIDVPQQPVVKRQFENLQQALSQDDPALIYDAEEEPDGKIKIKNVIRKKNTHVKDRVKVQDILDRLQGLYPALKTRFITEEQLASFDFGDLTVDLGRVNSFVRDGTIYLVEGRVTAENAVEEFLHPFVSTLREENPELYQNLLQETHSRYPGIVSLVESNYTSARGFTENDRQNEIVTKVIGHGLSKKITREPTTTDYTLAGLLKQFLQFLTNVFRKVTGKARLYIGEIPTNASIDDIITLLDDGLQVELGPMDKRVYFNLTDERLDIYNQILDEANEIQREIVEDLARNNALFFEDTHKYIHAETGEEYSSVTKLIKGKIDEDDAYAINRAFGKEFDFIMNAVVLSKSMDEIRLQLKLIKPEVAKQFYDYFKIYLSGIRSNGSIVIPQLVLADDQSMVAGTLDLLIIDPAGNMDIIDLKVSKNSILGKSYDKPWRIDKEPSAFLGMELSTRQQHGIQQHGYKKLVELTSPINGKPKFVRSVKTLHFRIGIFKNKVIGFESEGYADHSTSNYNKYIDRIIPTELPKFPGYTTLLQAQALPENAPIIERIQDVVEVFQKKLRQRKTYYESINTATTGKITASEAYLTELSNLINEIDEELAKGSPAGAFYQIIKFINKDLKRKTEQINGTTVAKDKLVGFLLETEKDIKEYLELLSVPKLHLNNPTLQKLSKEALDFADSLQTVVDVELKNFIKDFVKTNSSRKFNEEQLDALLKETKDISQAEYLFTDLATSTDTLLATLDKVYKAKLQEIYDFTDELADELKKLGKRLAELNGGKPVYDFMIHKDKDGKPTGYYVRKIGSQYWSQLGALKEKIQDDNGRMLKYREVFNLTTANQEDLDYNLQLMEDKNAYRTFMQAETLDALGTLQDGEYHRYTEEFKRIRNQYEYLHIEKVDGEIIYHEWRKRKGVTETDYKRYLAKYYTEEITYLSPVKENLGNGIFINMGRVVERSSRFVNRENIEVREYTSTGQSLLDSKYEKLQNPTSELEKAQKDFYDAWIKHYEKQLQKLPTDQRRKMSGRLPLVWDRFVTEVKAKPVSVIMGILKGIRNLNPFDLKIYSHNVLTNEDGEIENQVPVFYVGDFQNAKSIEQLEKKIKELGEQLSKKQISLEEYKAKLKSTKQALIIEKGKITRDQLSTDMVENMITFAHSAEKYRVMSAFENTLKAIHRMAAQRTYTKEGPSGTITSSNNKEAAKFPASQSLTLKRLEKWKEMIFYRTSNPYHSKWGQIARKMMQYLSLKSVALNPFGQLNNYVIGNINNIIEAAGGIYFDREAYSRAWYAYNKDFLKGLIAKRTAKIISKGDYYVIDKPYSKYEAFASMFRMMRKLQSGDVAGGYKERALDPAYVLQESVEYNIQTKTGMAVLMTKTLVNSITNEECSIYDAFEFNQKEHKLVPKKGFDLPPAMRHEITNYIYEVNKQLHGNHAEEDKMVIQQHLMGELAAQFHKHVAPFTRSRYGGEYEDENLGKVQGRYRTVWSYMQYAWDLKSMAEGWNQLSDRQKRNVFKASADLAFMMLSVVLYHLFSSIGQGIDDDDETTKKFVNLLTAQSDRVYDEIAQGVLVLGTIQQYQMLKSPLASLGFAKDCLEVVYEATKAPIPPYDDLYFKRGVNQGELRISKELMDVIPVLNLVNRWDSYETVKQFYIR